MAAKLIALAVSALAAVAVTILAYAFSKRADVAWIASIEGVGTC